MLSKLVRFLRDYWLHLLLVAFTAAVVGVIALAVEYTKKGSPHDLVITTPLVVAASPVVDSGLGAAAAVLSSFFTSATHGQLHTRVVYNAGAGKLCVRTEDSSFRNTVQCIEGANPKSNTPIVMLDWVGGPSIIYITGKNVLSSLDNAPTNNTWRLSTLINYNIKVHEQSQIAAAAWLNGTSEWIYYQDANGQLREIGKDDYRDQVWREGSAGPLGPCKIGSGIGVVRWLGPTSEVEEVFCQANNLAIQGRKYIDTAWNLEPYSIQYTPSNISAGTAITATTMKQGNDTLVLLAYQASSGSLAVQTRRTTNLTDGDFRDFSLPTTLVQGDGRARVGLAATSWPDQIKIYFVVENRILELSCIGGSATNWTTATVPF